MGFTPSRSKKGDTGLTPFWSWRGGEGLTSPGPEKEAWV